MAVFTGAALKLCRVWIDGSHREPVEAAADLSVLVDDGNDILATGCDDYDLVAPYAQHRLFIADIGPSLFPPAFCFLEGQLVKMGDLHGFALPFLAFFSNPLSFQLGKVIDEQLTFQMIHFVLNAHCQQTICFQGNGFA